MGHRNPRNMETRMTIQDDLDTAHEMALAAIDLKGA